MSRYMIQLLNIATFMFFHCSRLALQLKNAKSRHRNKIAFIPLKLKKYRQLNDAHVINATQPKLCYSAWIPNHSRQTYRKQNIVRWKSNHKAFMIKTCFVKPTTVYQSLKRVERPVPFRSINKRCKVLLNIRQTLIWSVSCSNDY